MDEGTATYFNNTITTTNPIALNVATNSNLKPE